NLALLCLPPVPPDSADRSALEPPCRSVIECLTGSVESHRRSSAGLSGQLVQLVSDPRLSASRAFDRSACRVRNANRFGEPADRFHEPEPAHGGPFAEKANG